MIIDRNELLSWQASYRMGYSASASVALSNVNRRFSPTVNDLIGHIITLYGIVDGTSQMLFRGRITAQHPSYNAVTNMRLVSLEATSVYESLNKKPVNTHTYGELSEEQFHNILNDLLRVYGGLPDDFFLVNELATNFKKVTFAENSLMDGLKKLAQAAQQVVYPRYDGRVVTGAQKNWASSVEYTLEPRHIEGDVAESWEELELVSACKVRGRYLMDDELYGAQILLTMAERPCRVEDEGHAIYSFRLDDIGYSTTEIVRARVKIDSPENTVGYVAVYEPPIVKVGFSNSDDIFTGATTPITFSVNVTLAPSTEIISVDAMGHGLGMRAIQDRAGIHQMLRQDILAQRTQDRQRTRLSNEQAEHRLDVLVGDNALIDKVGLRYTEVDNVYISTEDMAKDVATRAIYESNIGGHQLSCQGPINLNLIELNKVVNVPIFHGDVVDEYIKCLLAGLTINYSAEAPTLRSNYTFLKL